MYHENRLWSVMEVDSVYELAHHLEVMTWPCCQAFRIRSHSDYLWLNDAESFDENQDYAVCHYEEETEGMRFIASVCYDWMTCDEIMRDIQDLLSGKYDQTDSSDYVSLEIESSEKHTGCSYCK